MKKSFMLRIIFLAIVLSVFLVGTVFAEGQKAKKEWPSRPIQAIVGWSAGGTSDTTVRALAKEMSSYLKVEIKVSNVGGANGGIAYQNVYKAPPDGYTWFGGAQVQATYLITKQANVSWRKFYSFPAAMGTTTIYVRSDSGYKDLNDLVNAIKNSNKKVKYGTTSRGGNGSIFAGAFVKAAGISDKVVEVPYNGGREAGRYLLSGAVEFISVSLGDVSDWAEGGTIKPLANLYGKDVKWHGVLFPSIKRYYPKLVAYTAINPYWGIAIRRDTPDYIVEKIAKAFVYAVKQDSFKKVMDSRGIIVDPLMGVEADKAVAKVGSARGWAQYEYGIVKTSPAKFNIPKITEWSWPPNEAAKKIKPWPKSVEELYKEQLAK